MVNGASAIHDNPFKSFDVIMDMKLKMFNEVKIIVLEKSAEFLIYLLPKICV